ncbi:MAG TPA: hypothetical protein VG820_04790 [Fimbriimonadaceae bacterium]|nr:hypothetical protein [Fimbriimonadaceae bacterium]
MNTKLVSMIAVLGIAGAANAQLTGFRVSAGYGWSGGIKDSGNVSRTMSGPELMASFPLQHLPMVDISLEGDILFGGGWGNSSIKGNIYRLLATARMQLPGSQVGAWLGFGYGSAQGSGGDFASVNGLVTQVGLSFPMSMHMAALSPSLEVAADWGSKTAISGFSVSLALRF